jgi:hypothetical protein
MSTQHVWGISWLKADIVIVSPPPNQLHFGSALSSQRDSESLYHESKGVLNVNGATVQHCNIGLRGPRVGLRKQGVKVVYTTAVLRKAYPLGVKQDETNPAISSLGLARCTHVARKIACAVNIPIIQVSTLGGRAF